MRAGRLRNFCTLMQAQQVKRPGGGLTESWIELGKLWAEITTPTGRTQPVADQIEAVVSAEIRVRYRADIVAGMRIGHGSKTYKVEAPLPDNDQAMLRLLCSSVTNP